MSTIRDRSLRVFPGGSNGEFNLPRELVTVLRSGKGCEVWDCDGRRFLDFSMGWGSVLVGHARPEVVEAVRRQAGLGSNFAFVSEESLLLAEEILRISPACESLRFCASGTEANLYVQRLARAFTGKPKLLKFEGAYHGAGDVGVASLFPQSPPDFPEPAPTSAGVDAAAVNNVLVAPFNRLGDTAEILARLAGEIAAVTVEPLQRCTPPQPGFLEGLRELTRKHGLLLIFDEVVTGFRLAYGGAQEYYGVVPDLVAYGKALGGGYPIGAFGGKREIIDLVREDGLGLGGGRYVWMASTLGGTPVSCAAARATLSVLSRPGTYERLRAMGERVRGGMRRILCSAGVAAQVVGDGPLAQVIFTPQAVIDYRSTLGADRKRARDLMLALFRRGVFLNPMGTKLYLSLAHDEAACDEFLGHFEAALAGRTD